MDPILTSVLTWMIQMLQMLRMRHNDVLLKIVGGISRMQYVMVNSIRMRCPCMSASTIQHDPFCRVPIVNERELMQMTEQSDGCHSSCRFRSWYLPRCLVWPLPVAQTLALRVLSHPLSTLWRARHLYQLFSSSSYRFLIIVP